MDKLHADNFQKAIESALPELFPGFRVVWMTELLPVPKEGRSKSIVLLYTDTKAKCAEWYYQADDLSQLMAIPDSSEGNKEDVSTEDDRFTRCQAYRRFGFTPTEVGKFMKRPEDAMLLADLLRG